LLSLVEIPLHAQDGCRWNVTKAGPTTNWALARAWAVTTSAHHAQVERLSLTGSDIGPFSQRAEDVRCRRLGQPLLRDQNWRHKNGRSAEKLIGRPGSGPDYRTGVPEIAHT
jgi:hypothetical protein